MIYDCVFLKTNSAKDNARTVVHIIRNIRFVCFMIYLLVI